MWGCVRVTWSSHLNELITRTRNRAATARTCIEPTQLTLLEHRLQPTPPLTGQDGPVAYCSPWGCLAAAEPSRRDTTRDGQLRASTLAVLATVVQL